MPIAMGKLKLGKTMDEGRLRKMDLKS